MKLYNPIAESICMLLITIFCCPDPPVLLSPDLVFLLVTQ